MEVSESYIKALFAIVVGMFFGGIACYGFAFYNISKWKLPILNIILAILGGFLVYISIAILFYGNAPWMALMAILGLASSMIVFFSVRIMMRGKKR